MTATPPYADLHIRAVEALDSLPDCPPDHWGGRDILDPCVNCQANAVLAAVLPDHRKAVLAQAADALETFPLTGARTADGQVARRWFNRAAEVVRRFVVEDVV